MCVGVGGVFFQQELKTDPFLHEQDPELIEDPPLSPSPSAQSEKPWGWIEETNPKAFDVHTHTSSYPIDWQTRQDTNENPIGIVYLTASQNYGDPLHVGELNIGIILQPEYQGKGYACEVVRRVASIAFDEEKCHRLQAILLEHVAMDRALSLFTKM